MLTVSRECHWIVTRDHGVDLKRIEHRPKSGLGSRLKSHYAHATGGLVCIVEGIGG